MRAMTNLEIAVEFVPANGALLVRPTGQLTVRNRHRLRAAVMKCLADCPSAVVVDLARCQLVDRLAAAVFVAMRREAAVGPAINVLVAGADPTLAERITALDPRQPMFATAEQALRAISHGPAVATWRRGRFPAVPEATSLAGCLVADACVDWLRPDLTHLARLVMFDLVHDSYVCAPAELRVIVAMRSTGLVLSVRAHTPVGHTDHCALDREPRHRAATPPVPSTVTYYRTATASDHLNWAVVPAAAAGPPRRGLSTI